MRFALRVTVVALVVVVAGCGSTGPTAETSVADSPTPTATATEPPTTAQTPSPTPTATPTQTRSPTPTPNPAAQNPWDAETVRVTVETTDGVEQPARHRRLLEATVRWANADSSVWSAFPIRFAAVDERDEADVVVTATPTIAECGDETATTSFGYCAPSYDVGDDAPPTEDVSVASRIATPQLRNNYRGVFVRLGGVDSGAERRVDGVRTFDDRAYRDPWPATQPVVVGVENDVSPSRNVTGLVEDAVAYWESGAGAPHRNYTTEFAVRPDASDPDVTVAVVEDVVACGTEPSGYTVGCAPVLDRYDLADEESTIRVAAGYTDASTRETLRHEFGHLHGRLHGQDPLPLMNATGEKTRLPQPNASERRNAWEFSSVDVYLGRDNLTSLQRDNFQGESIAALRWVENGAGGAVRADIDYELVDDRSDADVVIEYSNDDFGDSASTSDRLGRDVDADEALEVVSSQRIVIADTVDTRNVGYHVAYWLVAPFFEDSSEHPEPIDLDDDDREDFPE